MFCSRENIYYFCVKEMFLRGRVQLPTGGNSPRLPFEGLIQ